MAIEAKKQQQRINEQIRVSPVRVIGDDGAQLGIMTADEAIKAARKIGLDLVEVAPTERPPVCRIMDFGKFKYQQKKRQHKGHTHQLKIKEIRVRPKTGEHDIGVKVNHAREFLVHKNKVVVTVVFRGRELAHLQIAVVRARTGAAGHRRGGSSTRRHRQGRGDAVAPGSPDGLYPGAEVDYLRRGRVRGVLLSSVWERVDAARRLIGKTGPLEPAGLHGRLPL